MNRLDGKVALISGAARGIGGETARAMAGAGARGGVGALLDEAGQQTVAASRAAGGPAENGHPAGTRAAGWTAATHPAPRRLGLLAGRRLQDNLTLADLASLALPTLIVRGETSTILEPDAAERFRDALPKGALVTVPKSGHGVPSQNTLGFLAALETYLDTL